MADMHGLVIHLGRATARAGQVARLIGALPFPGEVLPAVDARAPGGLPAGHDPALSLEPGYPFPLTDVEVAIFNDVDSEVDSLNTDDTGLVWFCGFAGVSKKPLKRILTIFLSF